MMFVLREEQHDRAPVAVIPVPAEGRVPRGAAQHHLQPRLCQRGHWHPAAKESKPVQFMQLTVLTVCY